MLGLSNSIASSNFALSKLPINGQYIHLEEAYIQQTLGVTNPVTLHSSNEISFDDTYIEEHSFDGNIIYSIYLEPNNYTDANPPLLSGYEIVISGRVRRKDNGANFDDLDDDGYIQFKFNNDDDDNVKVFIDENKTGGDSDDHVVIVDNNGDFSVTITLESNVGSLNIQVSDIKFNHATTDPGVRISNLSLTKN